MTRKAHLLFCDNEHGTGDVTFPDVKTASGEDGQQHFMLGHTQRELRAAAKQAGWGRHAGADYCPNCMASLAD